MWFMDAAGVTRAGQRITPRVKVGDYVFLGKYQSGSEPVEINGKRYLICRENDIIFKAVDGKFVDVKLVAPDD
jgi:co-chaperonin GroES (HSP10)